jgi:hypothetical protein
MKTMSFILKINFHFSKLISGVSKSSLVIHVSSIISSFLLIALNFSYASEAV